MLTSNPLVEITIGGNIMELPKSIIGRTCNLKHTCSESILGGFQKTATQAVAVDKSITTKVIRIHCRHLNECISSEHANSFALWYARHDSAKKIRSSGRSVPRAF